MMLGEVVRIEGGREGDARFVGGVAERRAEGGFALLRCWNGRAGAVVKEAAGSAADAEQAAEWLAREGCDCATFVHAGSGGGVRPVWHRLGPWTAEGMARTRGEGGRLRGEGGRLRDEGGRLRDEGGRMRRTRALPSSSSPSVQVLLFEDGARRIA